MSNILHNIAASQYCKIFLDLSNCMALMAVPCLMGEKSENLLDFHEASVLGI